MTAACSCVQRWALYVLPVVVLWFYGNALLCVCSVITGAHRAAVASAVTRVEVLIDSFRRKQPFTHFLSFALNHRQVQQGFLRFREQVLERCGQVRTFTPHAIRVDLSYYINSCSEVLHARIQYGINITIK